MMTLIHVNGAEIFYELFGEDHPDRAPIVLIHGSTLTGRADWGLAAPLLAREYRVIVPDCRGHGRSTNPRNSYSFREMADDTAGLVKALGYPRAHIIGHSNGGNVALVTLLEHPEVVQTAVLQAANAFVSPDLVEREPSIFDPERVARERPDWKDEMIVLHGQTYGPDYWCELLRLTLAETITQPNYTSDDLRRVSIPALVIQGEHDQVNAPARHAQFIARHIPQAECWIPEGVGHNVHQERLFPWVERALDFLARRGDPVSDALYRLRRTRYADWRETIFEVEIDRRLPMANHRMATRSQEDGITLTGKVLTVGQAQNAEDKVSAVSCLSEVTSTTVASEIRVLLDDSTAWALVNRSVTDVRREPSNHAERVSQTLMGEAVRLLEESGEWTRIRLEKDGYLGWVHTAALFACTQEKATTYRTACTHMIKSDLVTGYLTPVISGHGPAGGEEAGKLPFGLPVQVLDKRHGAASVQLPDDRIWWLPEFSLLPLEERPQANPAGIAYTLALLRSLVGVPYLWGGRTPFGYDCSGLAQTFLNFLGVHAPRDADQQFRAGIPVEAFSGQEGPWPRPGDLLFFGEKDDDAGVGVQPEDTSYAAGRRITHVAISLGGSELIHANGAAWGVSYNSLNAESPIYRPQLRQRLAGARRFWA